MTPREIALSICEPWFNGDPCEECKCHKVCTKLVERIAAAIQVVESTEAAHIPDATKMIEPVAYVPEATKMAVPVAWAVITKGGKLYKAASTKESAERKARQQIDKLGVEWECSVVPLYLSPTAVKMVATSQESRQVEPVAWRFHDGKIWCYVNHISDLSASHKFEPLYTAPPKREPMTEQQLDEMFDQAEIAIYIADRQQKEHLEVYSFGVRDAEKWHGIGGEE